MVTACAPLLKPLGLRSLDPSDLIGRHRGSPSERDQAYHQGTVWPWLIGPYAAAALKLQMPTHGLLDGLEAHLAEWGLGSVSETADGDAATCRQRLPVSGLVGGRDLAGTPPAGARNGDVTRANERVTADPPA